MFGDDSYLVSNFLRQTLQFFDNILDQLDAESGSGSSAASTPDEDENDDSSKGHCCSVSLYLLGKT